ncbi:MAG: T9SS type A sorting domain-containing protein [Bacteroidales bacterium]|nr:T9SS type A sorting domain-containing protein [Bacteroidales bacterium]
MKDFAQDVVIKGRYYKISTITTDDFSYVDNSTGKNGENISVTFTKREGYKLTSATYNGINLNIKDYKASFTMPSKDVEIKTVYTPIAYSVSCTDANITADKTTATIDDKVNLTIKDRTSEGYKLDKVLVNSTEIAVQDFKASFDMKDYMKDVTITAQYSKIPYTITTDEFSQVANSTATAADVINVTFKQLDGYNLTSATYNGKALSVNNYKSSFTMPAANVEIKTQYSKIPYTITTDEYSQVANTTANVDDVINVTFKQCEGYTLTSATYNGTALTVSNYKSSFTMPAANVEIKTVYAPIAYAISCTDANITADKTTATIEDKVNLTFKNRTSEGYKLDKVLVNSTEIAVKDFKASFDMKDYLKDVIISAQYSKIPYTITTDEFSQVANSTATVDDAISVTFKQREGFDLVSATYNGNPLNINNYKASFTMPAQNVEIKTVYTEKVYEIEKPSEDVQISQPTAKAGDEINITVTIKDGYTAHLYVNGQEVALNGNLANYIMPSGKIEIKVEYVANPKTPVSEINLDNCAVSVFPNPAKSGEKITLKVGGKFDTNNTKIYIYNASGSLVMQIDDVQEYNQLTLRSGVYVGVLVTNGGKKTFRVAVE